MHDAMTERTHTMTMKPITMLANTTMPDWITCDPTSATTAEIASSAEIGKMSNIRFHDLHETDDDTHEQDREARVVGEAGQDELLVGKAVLVAHAPAVISLAGEHPAELIPRLLAHVDMLRPSRSSWGGTGAPGLCGRVPCVWGRADSR